MNPKPAAMTETELQSAFRSWKDEPLPSLPAVTPMREQPTNLGQAIALQIGRGAPPRRLRRVFAGGFGLLAAAAAVWVGFWFDARPVNRLRAQVGGYELWQDGVMLPVATGTRTTPLPHGVTLKALPGSTLSVEHESGAQLDLTPRSALRFDDEEAVSVLTGEVSFQVPKLGRRSFKVRTVAADVVVHGTQFVVKVDAKQGTQVSVFEGLVAVQPRHGGEPRMVYPGQLWRTDPVAAATAPSAPTAGSPPPGNPSPQQPPEKSGTTESATGQGSGEATPQPGAQDRDRAPATSSLGQQTQLFSRAMQAKEAGRLDESLRLLAELTRRFPDAPLATEARVESFRLRARLKASSGARQPTERDQSAP